MSEVTKTKQVNKLLEEIMEECYDRNNLDELAKSGATPKQLDEMLDLSSKMGIITSLWDNILKVMEELETFTISEGDK